MPKQSSRVELREADHTGMSAAKQCMPQADIGHDKFHVSMYLCDAVDTVRKQEHRRLPRLA